VSNINNNNKASNAKIGQNVSQFLGKSLGTTHNLVSIIIMTVTKSYFCNSDNIPKLSKFAGTVS
jgi:hypothetical protein